MRGRIRNEKWRGGRRSVLRGKPLTPSAAVADRYAKSISSMVIKMAKQTQKEIMAAFRGETAEEYFAKDASITSEARILFNALSQKFEKLFNSAAPDLADDFVKSSIKSSETSLRESLKSFSEQISLDPSILSGELKEVVKASIEENVALIKSIPSQYLDNVKGAVYRSITTGRGLADLVPEIQKQNNVTLKRARLIATDQTRKVYGSINRARMEKMGLEKFEWLHSGGGQHPRQLHQRMSGKIYSFKSPPVIDERTGERGFPGMLVNCFTGSTQVSLDNGCFNLWRYHYSGELINITLADGNSFECTLNHPILSHRGWISANEIQEGDYLACGVMEDVQGIEDKKTGGITTFEKIFNSGLGINPETSLGSHFDFHGDIPKENVDTISLDNELSFNIKAIRGHKAGKLGLAHTDALIDEIFLSGLGQIIKACFSGLSGKSGSFFLSQFLHSDSVGKGTISEENAIICQDFADRLSTAFQSFGKCKDAFPRVVKFDYLLRFIEDFFSSSDGRDFIAKTSFKGFGKSMGGTSEFLRHASNCGSLFQSFARVQEKTVRIGSCHVYTLESVNGWYKVTPAGIISKNCRCRAVPVLDFGGEDD